MAVQNTKDIRRIKYRFYRAGLKSRRFSPYWRRMVCHMCTNFPLSTLRTTFQLLYGAITQGGEPLNTSTHHNNDENNPPLKRVTMENDDNNNPDLDFDAIVEILQRLPVPSLMRAKSACSAWNTAISVTNFNMKNETDHFVTHQSYQGIAFFCAALNRWFPIPLPWSNDKWELCAAAKGLFLFHHFSSETMIYNVLTKQHRFLPRPEGGTHQEAVELMLEADHFEIIPLNLTNKALLYDSTTDEWKDIRINFLAGQEYEHSWKSTLHNGMAYFTSDFGRHLGCYDFARREFQFEKIEGGLPPKIDILEFHNNFYTSLPCLVSCNGRLLLVGRLEKEAGERGSICGGFPFIEHTLVGIWELDNNKSWSLVSVTPQDLLEVTVKSSHGTDFMVAASSDKIWLTIKGSMNVLTLNLMFMEWSVLPGYTAEDTVDTFPKRAFFVPLSISPSLILSANPADSIE